MDKVRLSDEVAAAAVDPDTAAEALVRIVVEYGELPAVFDLDSARQPGAPVLHDYCPSNVSVNRKIQYGEVDQGLAEADYVREDTFSVHAVSHAYLEPCAALAQVDQDGRITLWTSTQVPYIVQCLLASTLGMRDNDIRDQTLCGRRLAARWSCAKFARCAKTGRPVKFTLDREEEFLAGRRRHPMKIHSRVGFKKDGTLVARDLKIQLDGGAYNAMGPTATFLCGNFGVMLYRYPSYRFHGEHVYTNKPPASAMRGFGAPQSFYATEIQMNAAAEELGIDPVDLRIKNALVSGDQIPDVATVSSCGLTDSIKKVAEMSHWKERRKLKPGRSASAALARRGVQLVQQPVSFLGGGNQGFFRRNRPSSDHGRRNRPGIGHRPETDPG
jgi:4-hydroxybenzoyl-CoA reductase subunit alpha